jgi:hypothetical protein
MNFRIRGAKGKEGSLRRGDPEKPVGPGRDVEVTDAGNLHHNEVDNTHLDPSSDKRLPCKAFKTSLNKWRTSRRNAIPHRLLAGRLVSEFHVMRINGAMASSQACIVTHFHSGTSLEKLDNLASSER